MPYLTPRVIADITGGACIGDGSSWERRVAGAVRDNRDVKPGNLFVCIRGSRVDGHTFANSAFEAGAACCLVERAVPDAKGACVLVDSTLEAIKTLAREYRRWFDIPIIGVTGSVGKTSAKEMAAAVLGTRFCVHKTPENLNNEIGVPLTLLSLDESHEVAVIEMGISEFGEMSRLAEMVQPDICIITKIGHSHLVTLGDLNGVLRAKGEVFAHMGADGIAVLNGDDELLRGYDPGIRKITFGFGADNDCRAENVRMEGTGSIRCDIVYDKGAIPRGGLRLGGRNDGDGNVGLQLGGGNDGASRFAAEIPGYGAHLTQAALSASVVGLLLGMGDDEICRGMLSYKPVGGRANVTDTGFVTLIDDSYNANPESVKAALESLSALAGRRVAILGDMLNLGSQTDDLHREIGAAAHRCGVDVLICRGEKASYIYNSYISAGGKNAAIYTANDEIIEALPAILQKGDNVLVKASHGMRFSEIASSALLVSSNCL